DTSRQFDPWSMLPFDPDFGALTVITPPSTEAAGEAASSLARAGAGFILLMEEIPEPWLGPMEASTARSGAVGIGVIDEPSRAMRHASRLSLAFARTAWIKERGVLIGVRAGAHCWKNKLAPPVGETELEIRYPISPADIKGVAGVDEVPVPQEWVEARCES